MDKIPNTVFFDLIESLFFFWKWLKMKDQERPPQNALGQSERLIIQSYL